MNSYFELQKTGCKFQEDAFTMFLFYQSKAKSAKEKLLNERSYTLVHICKWPTKRGVCLVQKVCQCLHLFTFSHWPKKKEERSPVQSTSEGTKC